MYIKSFYIWVFNVFMLLKEDNDTSLFVQCC